MISGSLSASSARAGVSYSPAITEERTMQVGILGSGGVAQALGMGFLKLGHDVKLGSREPKKLQPWLDKAGKHASAGSFEETARLADIAVLATAWVGTENALKLAGAPTSLAGKLVIDVTNPVIAEEDKPIRLALG